MQGTLRVAAWEWVRWGGRLGLAGTIVGCGARGPETVEVPGGDDAQICPADAGDDDPRATTGSVEREFRIDLEASFDVSAGELFPYLHEPGKLGWLGHFRLAKAGEDPQQPSGLQSVRRVSFLVPIVEETIVDFAPPCELHYEVTYSRAFADHHARMRLVSRPDSGTDLHWTIDFDSKRRNGQRHHRFTQRYLKRALGRLQRRLERRRPTKAE